MATPRTPRLPSGIPNGKSALDAVNQRLLAALTDNPRLSASELARRVGMSAPAVR
ncbi:MAG: AsnC family transcriptional regulator, partial [Actinomycetota bacterium]|nr:AsnC family transcriptional regulator [Actinomycetota bacterium]